MGDASQPKHATSMPSEHPDAEGKDRPQQSQSHTVDGSDTAFHSQIDHSSPHRRQGPARHPHQTPSHQYGSSQSQSSAYMMGGMASALPDYGTPSPIHSYGHDGRPIPSASTPAVIYQLQQNLQYPHGSPTYPSPATYGGYPQQYHSGYSQPSVPAYSPYYPHPRPQAMQQGGGHYQQASMPYYYYQDAYGPGSGSPTYTQAGQMSGYPAVHASLAMTQMDGSQPRQQPSGVYGSSHGQMEDGAGSRSSHHQQAGAPAPRGPPRKPKQSGHALWVGNLPPGANISDLKDHFSRDATRDIESLFLISKSNCAFVNYRTENACQSAMQRFHDSRFQGVRLVCRLRRSSTPGSGLPTGPSSMTGRPFPSMAPSNVDGEDADEPGQVDGADGVDGVDGVDGIDGHAQTDGETEAGHSGSSLKTPERYFIVKSLTLQDLEQSVRNGIWATQSHNETALNEAFQSSDHVYLIFSANKSGEYFGYARMESSISEDATEVFGTIPRMEAKGPADTPRTVVTPATETAPKGRIIDDSARGTIFWEAEHTDEEQEEEKVDEQQQDGSDTELQTWGKPFQIRWLSTSRLPFYRTRGLRNPWNANREVKIARDGTELEPGVGRKLVQLFHRNGSGAA